MIAAAFAGACRHSKLESITSGGGASASPPLSALPEDHRAARVPSMWRRDARAALEPSLLQICVQVGGLSRAKEISWPK
jgi:hypothetical protein